MIMFTTAPANDLQILSLMAAKAAECASAHTRGPIRLATCEGFELIACPAVEEMEFESWSVRADDGHAVIAVFATTRQADGGRRMAASARFTFAAMPRQRRSRA